MLNESAIYAQPEKNKAPADINAKRCWIFRLTRQKWQDRLILQHRDYSFRIPVKVILISVNCRGLSKDRLTQVHIFRLIESDKIAFVLHKQKNKLI